MAENAENCTSKLSRDHIVGLLRGEWPADPESTPLFQPVAVFIWLLQ